MKQIETEELKRIQLDILKSIDKFCRNNNIRYSLAYGTLLGAVRHKGYIPWDDDLDIMMMRDEYDFFIENYRTVEYKVAALETDSKYLLPFAKVYDCRTVMDEFVEGETPYGVFIDIFPIDNAPDDENELQYFLSQKKRWNKAFILKRVSVKKGRSLLKNVLLILSHLLLLPFSLRFMAEKLNSFALKYKGAETKLKGIIAPSDNKRRELQDLSVFFDYIRLQFEDCEAMAIQEYDKYLKGCYGNYMELPPVEKRVSTHKFKAWWKD